MPQNGFMNTAHFVLLNRRNQFLGRFETYADAQKHAECVLHISTCYYRVVYSPVPA